MKWYKVEDYPVDSEGYVLVSQLLCVERDKEFCFMGKLTHDNWWSNAFSPMYPVHPTDRWCHIDLPED